MTLRRYAGILMATLAAMTLVACAAGDRTAPPPPPPPPPGTHIGYYVVFPPYGTSGGTGTTDSPWDLATALAGGHGRIQPGDTVWIRGGGTYAGSFRTSLNGTASAPIYFRQYPGERATIDGSLAAGGSYLVFWGFEVMQSRPTAVVDRVLEANTANGKFINLILHDAGFSGVSMGADKGAGVELYGSIIYNNGFRDNIDHGIYAHNATAGTKYITGNVLFNNFARGIQVYDDAGTALQHVSVAGNIAFNNGTIATGSGRVNVLISGPTVITGMVATDNLLYYSPGTEGTQFRLGNYDTSDSALYNKDIDLERNYAVGGGLGIEMRYQWANATVRDNVLIGDGATRVVHTGGPTPGIYDWSGNTYYRDPAAMAWEQNDTGYSFDAWKTVTGLGASDAATAGVPGATQVFVRPNAYEAGRGFVVIYNFAHQDPVSVDLSGILIPGQHYEIRNVQNVYGAPVTSGTYTGASVAIPMGGVAPPRPIGRTSPAQAPRTGPDFDVFLVTVPSS
jgi:hypothetical protein